MMSGGGSKKSYLKTSMLKGLMLLLAMVVSTVAADISDTYEEAVIAYENEQYERAIELFKVSAKKGNTRAKHLLGNIYLDGLGIEEDEFAAFRWYKEAAEAGLADAQYQVGLMYYDGIGTPEDGEEAKKWLSLAAKAGHEDAAETLPIMFDDLEAGPGSVTRILTYPSDPPSAEEIAKQVFFVNHFYAVKNLFIKRKGKTHITVLASRAKGKKASSNTLVRFLNNDYDDGVTRSKDIALFRSGKLSGTGMLITDYLDDSKSQSYSIWLPALKKIRRFSEPRHDDSWGGTDFTFGDVYLRKPHHESHELLGTTSLKGCLRAMEISEKEKRNKYLKQLHPAQCGHKGKKVYKLKSSTKNKNWWYDYRISYVDTKTFADYRTEYFKNGKKIKFIDRDWTSMKLDDPRGLFWRYWYGKNLMTGHETMVSVPEDFVTWDMDVGAGNLWTEDSLKELRQ
ncbi:MAG: outer membrane lipoprotein-sorting protein [Gammaproteobacteria bacterium]|nr:MAG: outer membrane lipoprotein-sorting protein [Gammaproteobacteria bacterium]